MCAPEGKNMPRKTYLDAVRAVAAFLVIVVHTGIFFPAADLPMQFVSSTGMLGVQLFFVLSAFLIFDALDRLEQKGGTLGEFFAHRFLRVAPLYWSAILVFTIINGHAAVYTVGNVIANVLFIHGLVPSANNHIVGGGWSVGTEVLFYLMAPALFALRRNKLVLMTIAVACFPLLVIAVRTLQPMLGEPDYVNPNGFLYFSILNQLPVFICGCLLFSDKERLFKLPALAAVIGWLAPLAVAAYLWWNYFTEIFTFTFVPLLAGISGVFFIVLMSKVEVKSWIVREFGRRAFSIYMFNIGALMLAKTMSTKAGVTLPFLVALPIIATLAFIGAGVTYRFIELPFMNLAKRLSGQTATGYLRRRA